ncbi:hypothetical protein [Planctomicrobium piriforme]|uniref:Uncharacterized protein n=1 Tax=Planctomicrobium piriforme TaxID=1576369 RepID=A0A1I3C2M0_9PLAN|nr:hypothetical protein [Planctomicrobium piriforme]SFH68566.1 hypothetical protein SAMN05421753_10253 [Planctomicrobium piriforme]
MADLTSLDGVAGAELSVEQIQGILTQIDLDLLNLVRDGKLSALKYGVGGPAGQTTDRAANLQALLAARDAYQQLLNSRPGWSMSQADMR